MTSLQKWAERMKEIDWLNWNGNKKENEMKAMIQGLRILSSEGGCTKEFVSKLSKEILKIHSPSIINEEGGLRKC
jgi:hypothetical protein